MAKPGIKYAALLIPTGRDQERDVRQFTSDIITWRGKLPDHMDASADVQHWREWIGSLAWDALMGEQRIVLASMPSERPEVLDAESQKLESRLNLTWYAYVLAAPSGGCHGQSRLVGGQAVAIAPKVSLLSIREQGDYRTIERPLYRSRETFTNVWPWRDPDPWLDRWGEWIQVLDRAFGPTFPVLLDIALFAFGTALERNRLDFSIPEFVRTADCILATRKGRGEKDFIERALRLAPGLLNHWYVGGTQAELETRIAQLYRHRSDCVHGKVPFQKIDADEAARLEYLAEMIAREAISFALRRPHKYPALQDRDQLEAAWADGSFYS
jgi:hypothetical protein